MLVRLDRILDLLDGIAYRGVVPAAEFLPDRLEGHLGDLPHAVDCSLPCRGDRRRALFPADVVGRDIVGFCYLAYDPLDGCR